MAAFARSLGLRPTKWNLETANARKARAAYRLAGPARAARLTVARVDAGGKLTLVTQLTTHEGARNGVVTKEGTVYLAHSQLGPACRTDSGIAEVAYPPLFAAAMSVTIFFKPRVKAIGVADGCKPEDKAH